MKTNHDAPAHWAAVVAVIALLAAGFGCDGSSSTGTTPETDSYRLQAVLVKDINADPAVADTSRLAVVFERNDSVLTSALVTLNNDTLVFNRALFPIDSVYSFANDTSPLILPGAYGLGVVDGSKFGDTVITILPDTFSISFYTFDSTIDNTNGQEIQISWTSAANIEGYVVAVVLEDSINTEYAYSQYVTDPGTQTTIPPDAYRLASDTNGVALLDTGWYQIFVYGYTGIPDSVLSDPLLPVPMPSNLPGDNVDQGILKGRVGTVVVTKRVRSHVVSQ